MANQTKVVAEPGKLDLLITREFDAPRDLVFRAHCDPDYIVRWWGPRRFKMTIDKFDPRSGGSWRFIHSDDQGNRFAFHGVYHELSPYLMVDTFEFEGLPEKGHVSLETARLEPIDGGGRSRLTIQVVFQSVADRDGMLKSGMEQGLAESHERLDEILQELIEELINKNEFVITRVFNAPKERIFKAWTEPEDIKKWWGPVGFTAPYINVDLRVGGKYNYAMQDAAGKLYWSGGEFLEVGPDRILVNDHFSDENGNLKEPADYGLSKDFPKKLEVTVTFKEEGGKTRLTISYRMPEDRAARLAMIKNGMSEGWSSSLDKMQALVEKRK